MLNDTNKRNKSAKILKALGNPYRLQIVELLMGGEKNVSEINQTVKVSQPSLSQHLSKLRREGVLGSRRDQRQIYYYLTNRHVERLLHIAVEISQDVLSAPKRIATAK